MPELQRITQAEAWKLNLLNIVREHREKCDQNCHVSLMSLREMAEAAGVQFSETETKLFF